MSPHDDVLKDALNFEDAAKYIGVHSQTLRNWLWKEVGPRNFKYMGRVYFKVKDLDSFKRTRIEVRAG